MSANKEQIINNQTDLSVFDTLIFDIGNVLISIDIDTWINRMREYNAGFNEAEFWRVKDGFDYGKINEAEICSAYRRLLNNSELTGPEIKKLHCSLLLGPTKAGELLIKLVNDSRFKILILSDTDPWHMEVFKASIPGFSLIDEKKIFASYAIGACKEDIEGRLYKSLLKADYIDFTGAVYFEDRAEYIDKAHEFIP
ncbi:MAG: hypothetical protein ABIH39_05985, partial [Candidatus Margulisiibacteriota bacterium]